MTRALLLLAVLGCQTKEPPRSGITPEQCPIWLAKARPTLEQMAVRGGMTYTKSIEDSADRDCRADVAAGKPMLLPRCVLDATSEAAIHSCFPTYDQVSGSAQH